MKKIFANLAGAARYAVTAMGWVVLLCLALTAVSCGGDDEDNGTDIIDGSQTGGEEENQQSIYQPEMFFGVWKLTETVTGSQVDVEDDPNSEWQRVFFTDEWDGKRGEGQTRLFTNGGFRFVSDYEWWLGSGNLIHIMEYDSGAEAPYEVYFEDGGRTMLLYYVYDGPSSFRRYVKVD